MTDVCPFCTAAAEWALVDRHAYQVARCACGALGVWFGMLADADEGAQILVELLDLAALAAPTGVPVGTSGMLAAVPYDAERTTRELDALLHRHGYELRLYELDPARWHRWAYWARAAARPS